MRGLTLRLLGALLLALCLAGGAQAADDFYKGKTIKLVVAYAPGGGYDIMARLMAAHMPKFIPGNPTIVVMNMPGAAGLTAANHLFNLAEKDGTTFGMLNRYSILSPLLGVDQARFKSEEFGWLGTFASYRDNAYVFWIRSALPHRTIDDLRNPKMPINVGRDGEDVTHVLREALDLNIKIISGYKGTADLDLAFERGETDGDAGGYDSVRAQKPTWIAGFARPMIQVGRGFTRLDVPLLRDVPTAMEAAQTPEARSLITLLEAPLLIARPFAAPPGIPADRLAILRQAFEKAMNDPELIKDADAKGYERSPKMGEEVQQIIRDLAATPKPVLARYKKATEDSGSAGGG